MSPFHDYLKRWVEESIQQSRDELDRVRREGTWPSGAKIATPGELSQEIARLRKDIDDKTRELERYR